jgi:hypothetical protein
MMIRSEAHGMLSLADWVGSQFNFWRLSYHTVKKRLHKGLTIDEALAAPVRWRFNRLVYSSKDVKRLAQKPHLTREQIGRLTYRTVVELRKILGC